MSRLLSAKTRKLHDEALACLRSGRSGDAIDLLDRALKREPRAAELHHLSGRALQAAQRFDLAAKAFSTALQWDRTDHGAARRLSTLVRRGAAADASLLNPRGLTAALGFDDVDGRALGAAAFEAAKGAEAWAPVFAALSADGAEGGADQAAGVLLGRSGRAARADALARAALSRGVNRDWTWERLLTAARRRFLEDPDLMTDRDTAGFAAALARQCRSNEYVWAVSDGERRALSGGGLPALFYKPVHEVFEKAPAGAPSPFGTLIGEALAERETEMDLASRIPVLGGDGDAASAKVRAQYEANPYPRWLTEHLPPKGGGGHMMGGHFDKPELAFLDGPFKVLVAGCGTGEQAVRAESFYGPNADILALDLSSASLGHAARKAEDFGCGRLRFLRGDILNAGTIGETFKVIESIGVLHHMADPYRGWKALSDILEPRGLMFIGLYSAVARENVKALRAAFDERHAAVTPDAIRDFRHRLLSGEIVVEGPDIASSSDAHTLSNFRDLALHENEIPCRLSDIKTFLDAEGLRFRGFQLHPAVERPFVEKFGLEEILNLDAWAEFEETAPRTFDGMYLMWVWKPGH